MKNHMYLVTCRVLSVIAVTLALYACSTRAVALRTVKPAYQGAVSASGNLRLADEAITEGGKLETKEPLAAIADYLSAMQSATARLQRQPKDSEAMHEYDFALSRVFSVIHDRHIPPWTKPLEVKSSHGTYHLLSLHAAGTWHPADYNFVPVDTVEVAGKHFTQPVRVEGLGAPVVAIHRTSLANAREKFLQSGKIYFSDTAVARFENKNCDITLIDPLQKTTVTVGGRTFPLAADYSTSTAMLLADERLDRLGLSRVLRPGAYEETMRISRLQPYDEDKIPVLFVHGLNSTPETWMAMFNGLRADPEIRQRYQFWFYSYPTGYPYFYPAMVLRHELDKIKKAYPHDHKIVVVGHSMGSLIARLLITDSGLKIWNVYFSTPPAQTPMQPQDKKFMEEALIFNHRTDIGREIFIAGPQRGSELATHVLSRTFDTLFVHLPPDMKALSNRVSPLVIVNPHHRHTWQMPTSVATLTPTSRFVKAINTIPPAPGIPYHQIMGDRGRGDTPKSSDGVVPYWSSHLEGAQSELIVPAAHGAHENPQTIAEVRHILKLNLHQIAGQGSSHDSASN